MFSFPSNNINYCITNNRIFGIKIYIYCCLFSFYFNKNPLFIMTILDVIQFENFVSKNFLIKLLLKAFTKSNFQLYDTEKQKIIFYSKNKLNKQFNCILIFQTSTQL